MEDHVTNACQWRTVECGYCDEKHAKCDEEVTIRFSNNHTQNYMYHLKRFPGPSCSKAGQRYPADKCSQNILRYPLDSDLSGG